MTFDLWGVLQSLMKTQKPTSLRFHGERTTWLQPATLDEFLQLKWEHPDARVVVGNTEVGRSLSHVHAHGNATAAAVALSPCCFQVLK